MPNSPFKFSAYLNTPQQSVNGVVQILLDATLFDTGNNFNTSSYVFTAPVSGYYQFNYSVACSGTAPSLWQTIIEKNASIVQFGNLSATANFVQSVGSTLLRLNLNDTIGMYLIANGVDTVQENSATTFLNGYLVST